VIPDGATGDISGSWHTPRTGVQFVASDRFGQRTVEITREQWEGGPSFDRLRGGSPRQRNPDSSIPEAIATIVGGYGSTDTD
jgi:hypothetical protein